MSTIAELMVPRAYDVHAYEGDVRGQWVGGAPDVISATILAASYFGTAEKLNPSVGSGIGVVDTSTDTIVAYVGFQPIEEV